MTNLPPLPNKTTIAFDDSIEIKGFTENQMLLYAHRAVLLDRKNKEPFAWFKNVFKFKD